jgi:drug/metabolite transporter (DMT)-like permease
MGYSASSIDRSGAYLAVLAAGLFGLSTPLAKALLSRLDAILLAGLLYLGAGVGLVILLAIRQLKRREIISASLNRKDLVWLGGAVLSGGVLGPLLLMVGLAKTSAANASLLLNSEAVLTAVLAWTVFREHLHQRIILGMLAIVTGAAILSWAGRPEGTSGVGEMLIVLACLAWAVDNNLTRFISGGDAQVIACVTGLVAGVVNTGIGLWNGGVMPDGMMLLYAGLVGFFGYGLSLQLYVIALRHIGAARTGAYFSTAPFAGAIVALAMFHTQLSVAFMVAALLMALGVWLHLSEHHEHQHLHEALSHEHHHKHDEHHQHEHESSSVSMRGHSHPHRHDSLRHKHPHYPDFHHRHGH